VFSGVCDWQNVLVRCWSLAGHMSRLLMVKKDIYSIVQFVCHTKLHDHIIVASAKGELLFWTSVYQKWPTFQWFFCGFKSVVVKFSMHIRIPVALATEHTHDFLPLPSYVPMLFEHILTPEKLCIGFRHLEWIGGNGLQMPVCEIGLYWTWQPLNCIELMIFSPMHTKISKKVKSKQQLLH